MTINFLITKRTFLTLFVAATALAPLPAEVPEVFLKKPFTAATFAEAVNHFVAEGEENAVKVLKSLASPSGTGSVPNALGIRPDLRIAWLCRVLFTPKGAPIRPPRFGITAALPQDSSERVLQERWPLFPVAESGGSYFVLATGYSGTGRAESIDHYIDLCRAAGVFRTTRVAVPSKEQAQHAATTLRASQAWQTMTWREERYEARAWEIIRRQIEAP